MDRDEKASIIRTLLMKQDNDIKNHFEKNPKAERSEYTKIREIYNRELKKLGITLGCSDYGEEHCLDEHGLISVLNALEL
jgi:hypothetical protein